MATRIGSDLGRAPAVPPRAATGPSADRRSAAPASMAGWAAAGCLLLFAAWVVLSTLWFVALSYRPIPRLDEWDSFSLFDRIGRGTDLLSGLFAQHNEHRLFFPRLVLFSDYRFFGGLGLLDRAVIFAVQAAEVALFAWLALRSGAAGAARWGLGAVAAALLFSLRQSENLTWGFQVQFVGVFACASLGCTVFAFGLDAGRRGRRSGTWLAAAAALAGVDAFTMSNGLLAAPVLVALAILARVRLSAVLALAGLSAALFLVFFAGYTLDDSHPSALGLLRNAPLEVAYTAGYLGNFSPFGEASQVAFGGIGLIATAGLAALVARERGRDPARLALLGIALFVIGTAALTALGRAGGGLHSIASSRYATGAATFWAALVTASWSLRGHEGLAPGDAGWPAKTSPASGSRAAGTPRTPGSHGLRRIASAAATAAVVLFLMAACWRDQVSTGRFLLAQSTATGAVEDAMLLDLIDGPALAAVWEDVDDVRGAIPALKRRGLSIFGLPDAFRYGRPLAEVESPGAPPFACSGSFDVARADPALGQDGAAVSGASSVRSRLGTPVRVYIVDGGRRVVGFAQTGFADGAWKGYARVPAGSGVSAYAVSGAGRTCRLGSAVVAGPPG